MKPRLLFASMTLLTLCVAGLQPHANANALHFAGDGDRVQALLPTAFNNIPGTNFTIAGRVRLDATATPGRVLFAQHNNQNSVSILASIDGKLLWYVVSNGVTYSLESAAHAPGQWVSFAARWNAIQQQVTLFTNGASATSLGGNTSLSSNNTFTLGAKSDGTQGLLGAIDELAIWPVWLSDQSAHALSVGICMDLATNVVPTMHYDFEVGTPGGNNSGLNSLPDMSGNGYFGILTGFALQGSTSNWIASPNPSCFGWDGPLFSNGFEATP